MDHQDYDQDLDIPPYASQRQPSRGFDPEMRRMAIIAGGLAVVIVGVALVWGGVHPRLGPPPVIKPPSGPMRTVPKNPGGLQVPGANEQIMSGTTVSGPPQLAPPPPAPDLSRLAQEAASSQSPPLPSSPPPRPAAPEMAASEPPLPLPPALPPAKPAAAPASSSSAAAAAVQVGKALPKVTPPAMAEHAGPFAVQLAALTSRPKADAAWQTLLARVPDLLAGRKPVVVPGNVKGRTYYRLRLGGFQTAAAAADFCARLKVRHVSCYIPK